MQAIEFEATTFQHSIRVPDSVPDGTAVRVLLLVEETSADDAVESGLRWKNRLAAMPDVGDDTDFSRPMDYGRDQEWDF